MLTTSITSILLTCLWISTQGVSPTTDDELLWNEYNRIGWEDFRGQPDKSSKGDAGTAVQIRAKPYLIKKQVHYDVVAVFKRNKSWVRDTSASLLRHEQLHFDIAELYARKVRQKVEALNKRGVKSIETYNEAIRELLLESNNVDRQYDTETLHGALAKQQRIWSAQVAKELESLSDYKRKRKIIGGN